jgi:hypothetical protein
MNDTRQAALRALHQLRDATIDPPAGGADPDEVLTRGGEVLAAREQPLRELTGALARDPTALDGLPEVSALCEVIRQRAESWHAALACAKHLIGERICSVARLRGARR